MTHENWAAGFWLELWGSTRVNETDTGLADAMLESAATATNTLMMLERNMKSPEAC
jgi:hypothetical protein